MTMAILEIGSSFMYAINLARKEALKLGHEYIGTEHLLLALADMELEKDVSHSVLKALGVEYRIVLQKVKFTVGEGSYSTRSMVSRSMPKTPRFLRALELSIDEAKNLGHNYVGALHLFLGLIGNEESVAYKMLEDLGCSFDRIREKVVELMSEVMTEGENGNQNSDSDSDSDSDSYIYLNQALLELKEAVGGGSKLSLVETVRLATRLITGKIEDKTGIGNYDLSEYEFV